MWFRFFLIILFTPLIVLPQNKLAKEGSLYLRQHSKNPVYWNPWGEHILNQARDKEKLVIISIGYSSCHWCRVMEEQTFQDTAVAQLMNDNFINIKVDREERPDIDAHYMKVLKTITGRGGWPMNIVALPDGRAIWAGTYIDKNQWISTLKQLNVFYQKKRSELIKYAIQIDEGISRNFIISEPNRNVKFRDVNLEKLLNKMIKKIDSIYGGFGNGEKFMSTIAHESLLRYAVQKRSSGLKNLLRNSLNKISFGGVNDQIGGGFHRYTTDRKWKIPHFEKMLYDNVQMLGLYAKFFQVYKDDLYKQEAYRIIRFLNREMKDSSNLFYSSIAADNQDKTGKNIEGDFYTWSLDELKVFLQEDFDWYSAYYNLSNNQIWGNNRFILFRGTPDSTFAKRYNWSEKHFQEKLKKVNGDLYALRKNKNPPVLDKKIIFSWNALAITELLDAYKSFGDPVFLEQSQLVLKALLSDDYFKNNRISHTKNSSKSILFLEDYAFLIDALISLYEVTTDESQLLLANELMEFTLNNFINEKSNLFNFSINEGELITNKLIKLDDDILPSANSKMAENLFKLYHFFGYSEYKEIAEKMTLITYDNIINEPLKYSSWIQSVINFSLPFYEIAITGPKAEEKLNALFPFYLPNSIMSASSNKTKLYLLKERYDQTESYYYVCLDNFCRAPVETAEQLLSSIDSPSKIYTNTIYFKKKE